MTLFWEKNSGFAFQFHSQENPIYLSFRYLSPKWWASQLHKFTMVEEKFWISVVWNAPKWRIWASSLQNIFTMVEENFGFQSSEMLQNEEFEQVHYRISSSWLKKILDFSCLKCSEMKNLSMFITEYLLHGWRKFWISIVGNAPKWRILAKWHKNIKG